MRGTLHTIERINCSEAPPEGATQIGFHPTLNRPIYEIEMTVGESDWKYKTGEDGAFLRDANGEKIRVYQLHPTTAQPLFARRTLRAVKKKRVFYLENDGQANQYMVDYKPPTAEQIAAAQRAQQVTAMGGGKLGEMLVDAAAARGLSPDEVLQMLLNGNRVVAEADGEPDAGEAPEWPKYNAGGWATFSDGSKTQLPWEDAVRRQAELDVAAAAMRAQADPQDSPTIES